ncbi:hypothetical protein PG990_006472 [Apiospora arundinis]
MHIGDQALVAYDPGYGLDIDTRADGPPGAPGPGPRDNVVGASTARLQRRRRPPYGGQSGALQMPGRLVDAGIVPEGRSAYRGHVLPLVKRERQRHDHRRERRCEPGRHGAGPRRGLASSAAAPPQVPQSGRKRGIGRLGSGSSTAVAGVELPAAATPLGRSRTDSTKRKPASEPPGALDQRVVAELDEGWQR